MVIDSGGFLFSAATRYLAPQKNTNTQKQGTTFSAVPAPSSWIEFDRSLSTKTFVHLPSIHKPGSLPCDTNSASQALYKWLLRSVLSTCGCQRHGMRTTAESPTTWLAVLDRGSKPALLGIESGFPIWILSGASYASPALGTTLAGCRTRCVFCKACGYRTFLARHSCDCTYSLLLTNIARVWYRFACSLEQTLYTSPVIPAL